MVCARSSMSGPHVSISAKGERERETVDRGLMPPAPGPLCAVPPELDSGWSRRGKRWSVHADDNLQRRLESLTLGGQHSGRLLVQLHEHGAPLTSLLETVQGRKAELEPDGPADLAARDSWRARLWTFLVRPYLETLWQFREVVRLFRHNITRAPCQRWQHEPRCCTLSPSARSFRVR